MAHRRIIVQEIVSLDGFVADASAGLDFFEVVSDYRACCSIGWTISDAEMAERDDQVLSGLSGVHLQDLHGSGVVLRCAGQVCQAVAGPNRWILSRLNAVAARSISPAAAARLRLLHRSMIFFRLPMAGSTVAPRRL